MRAVNVKQPSIYSWHVEHGTIRSCHLGQVGGLGQGHFSLQTAQLPPIKRNEPEVYLFSEVTSSMVKFSHSFLPVHHVPPKSSAPFVSYTCMKSHRRLSSFSYRFVAPNLCEIHGSGRHDLLRRPSFGDTSIGRECAFESN